MIAFARPPVLLLAVISIPLAAQQQQTDTTKLPIVVTTAMRHATSILTTPLAVNKITSEQLRAVRGYGLEDALHNVPGVIAQSRYGTSDVRLIIRGFGARGAGDRSNSGTSRGIRVLLDGFPETEPDGRTAFDHIDLATAEQVEVIRSNASSLWGNAAGGVVNVLSVPDATNASLDVQPIVGDFGLRRIAVRAQSPLGRSGMMWASFTNSNFDGWRLHSDARRVLLNAGATGAVGDNTRLGVFLVAANNLMHIPGPLTPAEYAADPAQANAAYLSRDERRYNRLGRVGVTLDHDFTSTTSIASSFFVNPKYLQRSERGTYRDFTRYHIGGNVVGRSSVRLGETTHRLMLGADEAYQDGSIQFYTLTNNSRGALSDNKGEGAQNVGVFLQDEFTTLSDRLSLVVGARYDRVAYNYRTYFDPNAVVKKQTKAFDRVSPKLGASWKVASLGAVYANVGGGIEVPAGNETDQPPTAGSAGPTPGALLNPLLDAISSTTYEVGYKTVDWSLGESVATIAADVALYHTDVSNEIIPYSGGRYYQTAASAKRNGLELGLNGITRTGVFANAAISWNDHTYDRYVVDSSVFNVANTGKADLSGHQVMGVPKMFGSVDAGIEVPGYRNLRLSFGLEHSGKYFADDKNTVVVPSYTIYSLTAALRNPILARSGVVLRGFVQMRNLADAKYVGSAFLNPDVNSAGEPMVYEPGAPRSVVVSFSVGRK